VEVVAHDAEAEDLDEEDGGEPVNISPVPYNFVFALIAKGV
jgi:hypothetical protein